MLPPLLQPPVYPHFAAFAKRSVAKIAEESNLGFWSMVAKKRLEAGLDAARKLR